MYVLFDRKTKNVIGTKIASSLNRDPLPYSQGTKFRGILNLTSVEDFIQLTEPLVKQPSVC